MIDLKLFFKYYIREVYCIVKSLNLIDNILPTYQLIHLRYFL